VTESHATSPWATTHWAGVALPPGPELRLLTIYVTVVAAGGRPGYNRLKAVSRLDSNVIVPLLAGLEFYGFLHREIGDHAPKYPLYQINPQAFYLLGVAPPVFPGKKKNLNKASTHAQHVYALARDFFDKFYFLPGARDLAPALNKSRSRAHQLLQELSASGILPLVSYRRRDLETN